MENNRLAKFQALSDHPLLGRDFKRLRDDELAFCKEFLVASSDLSDDQFCHDVNRLGLKGELATFKNKSLIWAMLSQSIEIKTRRRRE